jgi:nucleotide-binding universal stress UspA family protein
MAEATGELTRAPRAVLCPIDFSDPARGALRYAMTVAAQANATLTVLTVNDLLLAQASDMARGAGSLDADARAETERFIEDTFSGRTMPATPKIEIATGTPDAEIRRIARDQAIDVIVMSSRGATGLRKLFLGSTTERVLRGTSARVLVTPPADPGPATFEDLRKRVRRILLPVDLSVAMDVQVELCLRLTTLLQAPLLLAHVIEPARTMVPGHAYAASVDRERRDRAERRLQEFVDALPAEASAEALVAFGDPAEEIAKIAGDRHAGLIVMGLHASATPGTRMGSVTYRVLSITHGLVLAVPPRQPVARTAC